MSVMIEPFLARHGDECGEERSSQTQVKDGLDMDNSGIRTTAQGESSISVGWNIPN